jgi:HAD superfamily hydrolase (TIGR01509 family)
MKLPRAILFDNDGVLVSSEPRHRAAWGRLLGDLGLPYFEEELAAMAGRTAPKILAHLLDKYNPGWKPAQFDLDALVLRKNDYYLESLRTQGLPAYPGVPETLTWLRQNGVRTAVVSNARNRELSFALKSSGLVGHFDLIMSRDEAPKPKPDPAGYLFAATHLQALPEEALVVEDSPPGIEAGLMGGIPSAAILSSFSREIMSQPVPGRPDLKPVVILESMQAFFGWLQGLPRS